jgi:hypothetical protein
MLAPRNEDAVDVDTSEYDVSDTHTLTELLANPDALATSTLVDGSPADVDAMPETLANRNAVASAIPIDSLASAHVDAMPGALANENPLSSFPPESASAPTMRRRSAPELSPLPACTLLHDDEVWSLPAPSKMRRATLPSLLLGGGDDSESESPGRPWRRAIEAAGGSLSPGLRWRATINALSTPRTDPLLGPREKGEGSQTDFVPVSPRGIFAHEVHRAASPARAEHATAGARALARSLASHARQLQRPSSKVFPFLYWPSPSRAFTHPHHRGASCVARG